MKVLLTKSFSEHQKFGWCVFCNDTIMHNIHFFFFNFQLEDQRLLTWSHCQWQTKFFREEVLSWKFAHIYAHANTTAIFQIPDVERGINFSLVRLFVTWLWDNWNFTVRYRMSEASWGTSYSILGPFYRASGIKCLQHNRTQQVILALTCTFWS